MENYFIRLIFIADKKQNTNGFSCQVQAKPKEVEESSTVSPTTPKPEPETDEPETDKPDPPKPEPTTAPPKPKTPAPTQPPPLSDPECGLVNRVVNRIVHGQFA